MKQISFSTARVLPKTLIIGVEAPYNRVPSIASYYAEFMNLVRTLQESYDHELFIKLREIDSGFFFTRGKLEEIKKFCEEQEIERVIISEPITAQQERNLEDYLDCFVIDRTQLILEIFEQSAHSAEGKTQVAIAMLQHLKTRLAGKGIHLSQQTGGIGVRGGPGETLKEREKRCIEDKIAKLRKDLVRIQKVRQTQRKQRLSSHIPNICLIGYTNAGKSTVINTLTHANVLAEDKLFATLDTTTRELFVGPKKVGLLSDTVGFIQFLPPKLIEAFKSTLSELQYADLLLHVVDISDDNWREHIRVVNMILDELKIKKHMLYVFNKVDQLSPEKKEQLEPMIELYIPHVTISATSKEGIRNLSDYLANWQRI